MQSILAARRSTDRPELWKRDIRGDIIVHNFHSHTYFQIIMRTLHNGAHHANAFFQFNKDYIIGYLLLEALRRTMADGEGLDGTPTTDFYPLDIKRKTGGAEVAGIEMMSAAGPALPDQKFVCLCAFPVSLCFVVYVR